MAREHYESADSFKNVKMVKFIGVTTHLCKNLRILVVKVLSILIIDHTT